ncbi:glycosyltransferase [Aliibacillus thermotolerans]|uniref:Glycosyltransferase n=1 Tax=Aliibacillus thermotolerans TaxID=1834418 RepID=A0ABW0U854_9BACI|nr:glycosyltransferase [Aliibacillus thermotolerans]MDA3130929.1 glycosyltransferase [Aliibacillus thermotolerans]
MRILMLSNMYPTEKAPSFGIFVKNQVEALMNENQVVDVLAITNPEAGKKNVMKKYSTWFLQGLKLLIAKGKRYDIVHAHYAFPSGLPARLLKRRFKTPYIVTCHGGDLNKMAKIGPFFYQQTQRILVEADHVIAVGQDLAAQIIDNYRIPKEKVTILSMGVDRSIFFERPKEEARKHLRLPTDCNHFLYVGNLIEEKGLLDLVEAYALYREKDPTAQLHIVGPKNQAVFFQRLQQKIASLRVEDGIFFHGAKPQTEVAQWMNAADVFVLPSHTEGFGLVAVEAMACGTPVIGTNVGGLRYLLADQAGEIVPVSQPEPLSQALEKVITDQDYRKSLIEVGRKRAETHDKAVITKKVIDIYQEALRQNE